MRDFLREGVGEGKREILLAGVWSQPYCGGGLRIGNLVKRN